MAKMEGQEALRKQEFEEQEQRFRTHQHRFSLQQMEVQARTSPTPDMPNVGSNPLPIPEVHAVDRVDRPSPSSRTSRLRNSNHTEDYPCPPVTREPRLEKYLPLMI